ncbi:zinc ABC transporter substrate-binding protein [Staphylococcus sp. SQ8-PEA]|uniref:Zinc ABC transporter substrate-binding protein n=1 Tax=Staphylococcus marylandisciuri TaxID=2981529 RepID=A0ABT2QS75_9STAP|nr:zinc ABC transporter substrate-binding protein [Staphylococcus marylandisciuri]MCU5746787.1 zinc ABC transporter substrate-binding protein [Staphylococcus marylandisciuri]
MKRILFILSAFILTIALTGCGKEDKKVSQDNKMTIHTTVFAYKSFVDQIGGKYVNTKSIYPAGADIHSYEPTQKKMTDIAKGDLFIYSGDDLDPVGKKISQSIDNKDKKLALADNLTKEDLLREEEDHDHEHEEGHDHDHDHDHSGTDPHVWLDPQLDKKFAKQIKDKLVAKDSKHKDYYEQNYKKLVKDLSDIDKDLKAITKNKKRDKVIISHDSLGYLAHRYDFEQEGVNGMNDEEPSQKKVMKMINDIKSSDQPYVLYEQNIPSKVTDVIRKETKVKPLEFHNLSVLTKDEQDKKHVTYQSIMRENIKSLDKALNE